MLRNIYTIERRARNISIKKWKISKFKSIKTVSEYDLEIPQSQTADNPVAPQGRAAQPS